MRTREHGIGGLNVKFCSMWPLNTLVSALKLWATACSYVLFKMDHTKVRVLKLIGFV